MLSHAWKEDDDTEEPLEPPSNGPNRAAFSKSVELKDRSDSAADDAGLEVPGAGEYEEASSSTLGVCSVSIDGDIERDALA